ncbi:MAG: HAD hydrolase-like protein [Candidatus Dojkabacteria bacterium]|nr:HAD hydrolase-like protein [Candidatus Dojkabacteria bacterium]
MEQTDSLNIENLKEVFDKREINTVAFDVDNTLMDTSTYFRESTKNLGILLARKIDKNENPEHISMDIENIMYEEFEKSGRKPLLIDNRYINALTVYLGRRDEVLEDFIIHYFKDFYTIVPEIYGSIQNILQSILKANRKIVLHSHAGEDWTSIKAGKISELIGYDIPYLATPIEQVKDKKNWLKALDLVNANPVNTLVVGDNLEADILPMLEIGSRNAVLINRHNEEIPEEYMNNEEINISTINDIGELFDVLK